MPRRPLPEQLPYVRGTHGISSMVHRVKAIEHGMYEPRIITACRYDFAHSQSKMMAEIPQHAFECERCKGNSTRFKSRKDPLRQAARIILRDTKAVA